MNITLRQLKVFIAVYKSASTTKAADELALSQSAVSMALNELEKQLAIQLFERIGKRLVINDSAQILYPKAMALLNQVEELGYLFDQAQGHIHIGASTTVGNYVLPALMAAFQKQYPNIQLSLHIHNTEQIAQGLEQLNYDIGFIEGRYSAHHLLSEDWLADELVLFVAKHSRFIDDESQSISLSALEDLPLVLRERGSGTRNTIESELFKHLATVNLLEVGHSEAIKQAVVHDMGIGCLSRYALNDMLMLDKVRIISLKENVKIKRSFCLIYNRQKYQGQAWQLFYDFCRQYVSA